MSKDTRKVRAAKLLEYASKGPSIAHAFIGVDTGVELTADDACKIGVHFEERYRQWAETWLVPLCKELVPELKESKHA